MQQQYVLCVVRIINDAVFLQLHTTINHIAGGGRVCRHVSNMANSLIVFVFALCGFVCAAQT
jgi:hypothetical protein